ncbi:MAG: DNA methyltransferase, partial [Bacteroidetes bacterium]|nr:DNA methyltransferase [Bacteroidota bacterium]
MEQWDDQSVDLIYLDPPFNSKANYNQLFHTDGAGDAQFRAFTDMWYWDHAAVQRYAKYENASGRLAHDAIVGLKKILGACGMMSYLTYMAERLEHCYRLLKPTGSIYLHCDPTASHYLKILMDVSFGSFLFNNEIIWHYAKGHGPTKAYRRKHDVILFYANPKKNKFNAQKYAHLDSQLYRFNRIDEDGKKYRINHTRDKNGEYKRFYLDDGVKVDSVWSYLRESKFDQLPHNAEENLGYGTQKPECLLERIILCATNEGDIVLDPFCGCGTTVAVAEKLNRQFVGIDISSFAIDLIVNRRLLNKSVSIEGIPFSFEAAEKLAKDNPFNFESWAVTRLPGFAPNTKQVADGGVDGQAGEDNRNVARMGLLLAG